jgi:very-short-patch-repair endonuclease
MPKKRRMLVFFGQVMLILLALPSFFMYFLFSWISPIVASPYLIFGFVLVASAILLETIAYEKTRVNHRNFSYEQSKSAIVTPQAVKLSEALRHRGIRNELEHSDGKKHVDIYVPEANLYLEIDGKYHLTDPEFLFRDLERDSYSHLDGIDTIRIPNFYVDSHLDEIANAIAEVARKRQECGIPAKQPRKIRY